MARKIKNVIGLKDEKLTIILENDDNGGIKMK